MVKVQRSEILVDPGPSHDEQRDSDIERNSAQSSLLLLSKRNKMRERERGGGQFVRGTKRRHREPVERVSGEEMAEISSWSLSEIKRDALLANRECSLRGLVHAAKW